MSRGIRPTLVEIVVLLVSDRGMIRGGKTARKLLIVI